MRKMSNIYKAYKKKLKKITPKKPAGKMGSAKKAAAGGRVEERMPLKGKPLPKKKKIPKRKKQLLKPLKSRNLAKRKKKK